MRESQLAPIPSGEGSQGEASAGLRPRCLDDSIVDGDQLDYLIRFCPTKEEVELPTFSGLHRKQENLGKCQQMHKRPPCGGFFFHSVASCLCPSGVRFFFNSVRGCKPLLSSLMLCVPTAIEPC